MAGGSAQGVGLDADDLARAHQALLRQHDLQFDFTAIAPPPPPPDWLRPLLQFLASLAPIFPYIFWGGLILGGVTILFFLLREVVGVRWPRFKRRATPSPPEPEWRPTEARARTLLEEADRLAIQGRYDEAAHLILFRSIEDIDSRWPNLVRPALTSRDIADHAGLPERARQTFGEIARVVERSFFGGRVLGAADFAFCRGVYKAFALPGPPA